MIPDTVLGPIFFFSGLFVMAYMYYIIRKFEKEDKHNKEGQE